MIRLDIDESVLLCYFSGSCHICVEGAKYIRILLSRDVLVWKNTVTALLFISA